jgi:hypothetical protein
MNAYPQDTQERRRSARVESLNLTSIVPKEGDAPLSQVSMARTLDLSALGAKIEVHQDIELGTRLELDIAMGEDISRVNGAVVHIEPTESGGYLLGIEFDQPQNQLDL